jgi:hypothetical protein
VFCANYLEDDAVYNRALYDVWQEAEWRDSHDAYRTSSCETCYPPDAEDNDIFQEIKNKVKVNYPNIDYAADEERPLQSYYGRERVKSRDYGMGETASLIHAIECPVEVAKFGICTELLCPLKRPTVESINECLYHDPRDAITTGSNFNATCLQQPDCINCQILVGKAVSFSDIYGSYDMDFASVFSAFQTTFNDNSVPAELDWEWGGAVFFATTIVTTIGYGNFAPVTFEGQLCLTVLAVPMVAIFGVLLSDAMNILLSAISAACDFVTGTSKEQREDLSVKDTAEIVRAHGGMASGLSAQQMLPMMIESENRLGMADVGSEKATAERVAELTVFFAAADVDSDGRIDRMDAVVFLSGMIASRKVEIEGKDAIFNSFMIVVLFTLSLVFGTCTFAALGLNGEEATPFEALYFCLVTASTAGLGDFVPDFLHPLSFGIWIVYIFFSLSLAGALISLIPTIFACAANRAKTEAMTKAAGLARLSSVHLHDIHLHDMHLPKTSLRIGKGTKEVNAATI